MYGFHKTELKRLVQTLMVWDSESEHGIHACSVFLQDLVVSVNVVVKHPGFMLEQLSAIHLHCT